MERVQESDTQDKFKRIYAETGKLQHAEQQKRERRKRNVDVDTAPQEMGDRSLSLS